LAQSIEFIVAHAAGVTFGIVIPVRRLPFARGSDLPPEINSRGGIRAGEAPSTSMPHCPEGEMNRCLRWCNGDYADVQTFRSVLRTYPVPTTV
jgi:hypothetical protein